MIPNQTRFDQAITRFDAANAQDPNIERSDGHDIPKELLYAQRMTTWLDSIAPDAPESVQLAARCSRGCQMIKSAAYMMAIPNLPTCAKHFA